MTTPSRAPLTASTLQLDRPQSSCPPAAPAPAPADPPAAAAGSPGMDKRIAALRRFAISISLFTIAGAFLLGFENSWAQPLVALAVAYPLDLLLETVEARAQRRAPKYAGGWLTVVNFLLPTHIVALSIALMLYPGALLMPIVFAVTVAIGSKYVLRVPINGRPRHFMNPSNLGIVVTLLAFPMVGVSPPYQFTENLSGAADWVLPGIILVAGTLLNAKLTGKTPLIMGWMIGLAIEILARAILFDSPLLPPLLPLTGVLLVVFTNYMITDPGTTPTAPRAQAAFGAAIAIVYGALVALHAVFGLFFALAIVCAMRGAWHAALSVRPDLARGFAALSRSTDPQPVRTAAP